MDHKWVLEAKVGLKCPILASSPLKLAFIDIEFAIKTPKILLSELLNPFDVS